MRQEQARRPNASTRKSFHSRRQAKRTRDVDTSDPDDPKQSFGITRRAQAYMDKQVKESHPFYLQLSYYAVHSQPQALASKLKKYEGLGGRGGAIQAAMTEDFDTCIGELLSTLKKLGIADQTYVIYMADNGMRSNALKGGKALLDEGGIRVPLIVQGPGIQGGTYCQAPAVGYDIFPTVLDFAAPNFALPNGVEGGSWKPVLLNAGIGQIQRPIDRLVFHHDVEIEHPQTAIRKGNMKLLHYWDTKQDFLYDLSADLREVNNLAPSKPESVESMLEELKSHVRAGLGEEKFVALESGNFQSPNRPGGGKRKDGKGKGKGPPEGKGPPDGKGRPRPPQ